MKVIAKKLLSICLTILLLQNAALALHIKGGWMSYNFLGREANGDLRYGFTVKVYRDCGVQSPGQNDGIINITLFNNTTNASEGNFAATLTRNYTLRKGSFSACISPVPDICYVILEYFGTVTVSPNSSGYTAAFQRCCRINGIINVQGPTNSLGNTYSIRLPGIANGANSVENSSPLFVEKDTAVVCFNSSFSLDYSAVDPDGDSLVYSFAPALVGASTNNPVPNVASAPPYTPVPYQGIFSAENPFGNGDISIDSRTGQITGISPQTTGEYIVAVSVLEYRNGRVIAETRKELHVNVANCSSPAAELPLETINCDGLDVTFQNNSISPAITSYFWDFGVPGGTSTEPRPTFVFPDTGVYVAKLIVNREQACSDSATTTVRVFPGFAPGFIADGSCFSNPFEFRDTTSARYGAVNSWNWQFGDPTVANDSSIIRNPTYRYSTPGTYNITFRATSTKGCDKTITVPLNVLDSPRLVLPFKDTLICSIDSLLLRAEGTGNYSWTSSTGRIINANSATPIVFPITTSVYNVVLNDRGCIARDAIRVNVLDFITVDAGNDTTICRGDPIVLNPTTQGLNFRWKPSNLLNDSTIKNPIAIPLDSFTTFTVIANLGKCQDQDTVVVKTVPYPIARVNADTAICIGGEASLQAVTNGDRFTWTPASLLAQSDAPVTTTSPQETTLFVFSAFFNEGCPKPGIDSILVEVIPPINIFAGNDTSIVYGQPFQVNANSTGLSHEWSPAFGMNNNQILNPGIIINRGTIPGDPGTIIYTLRSTTPEGCEAEDELRINVFSTGPSIFVPNAFTPNNDGLNDILRPIIAGIRELSFFRIYNRYGQLVFQTNNAELGWDGTIKGQPQGNGTFVYQVQAVDFNGAVIKQGGTISLIR